MPFFVRCLAADDPVSVDRFGDWLAVELGTWAEPTDHQAARVAPDFATPGREPRKRVILSKAFV